MRDFEDELKNKKLDIDNMEVPEELECRLREALNSTEKASAKKSFKEIWLMRHKLVAAALIVIVFLGAYNYDVFAYYGKKILGYDEVTVGSLKELNESGKGQEINKSYKFKNGAEVILGGVILDSNKLVAMYTIKGESEEIINNFNIQGINGELKASYSPHGGSGKTSDDKKEIRWVMEFEAPKAFDKNLTFNILCNTKDVSCGEMGKIPFKLDRKKAIQLTLKCNVNQTVDFQGIKYKFTTVSATPLSVVLEGKIQVGSIKDRKTWSNRNLNVELWQTYVKEGKIITEKIDQRSGGTSSGVLGIKFQYDFDGLKPNLKKLTLKVVKVVKTQMIGRTVDVSMQTTNIKVVPETEELIIRDVKEQDGNTIVTFVGEKDIAFVTALMIDGKQADTIEENFKMVQVNSKECLEKTIKFQGSGKKMNLLFKEISHETYINKEITVVEDK